MRRALLVPAICGISVASGAAAAPTSSRLHGVVMRGPISPVCVAERPCDAPAKHFTIVFSRASTVVARARTDSHGRYRLRLAPGRYSVRIGRSGAYKDPDPDTVRVPRGVSSRADFHLDTGIR